MPPGAVADPITVRTPEAVGDLGIGRSGLYQFIESGKVKMIKVRRATLVVVESLYELFLAGDAPDRPGAKPAWCPLRAVDDGSEVFIEFLATRARERRRRCSYLARTGERSSSTYLSAAITMSLTGFFPAAELRLGSKRQQIVRINAGQRRTSALLSTNSI